MKAHFFVLFCTILFLAANCAGMNRESEKFPAANSGDFIDGVYEGSAWGYRGLIAVCVRIEGGKIAEIEIVDSNEDRLVGGAALEELTELVLSYNTVDLDAVSGATESSEGFLSAIGKALGKAMRNEK